MSLDRSAGHRLEVACGDLLTRSVERLTHTDRLQPVPLTQLVQVQLHAGLAVVEVWLIDR